MRQQSEGVSWSRFSDYITTTLKWSHTHWYYSFNDTDVIIRCMFSKEKWSDFLQWKYQILLLDYSRLLGRIDLFTKISALKRTPVDLPPLKTAIHQWLVSESWLGSSDVSIKDALYLKLRWRQNKHRCLEKAGRFIWLLSIIKPASQVLFTH